MFSKKIFFDNVNYVANQRNLKISTLERIVGVTPGYLSKLRKDDSRKGVSIDLIFKIADALKVSVDYLCTVECDGLNDVELDLLALFEKVKKDTINNKCKWEIENANMIMIKQGHIGNALVDNSSNYVSLFNVNDNVVPDGISYTLKLKTHVYMALVRVKSNLQYRGAYLETYIIDEINDNRVRKLCKTTNDMSSMIDSALEDLYHVAEMSGKKISLDDDTSRFIKEFLEELDVQHYNRNVDKN